MLQTHNCSKTIPNGDRKACVLLLGCLEGQCDREHQS